MRRNPLGALAVLALVCGCTVGPNYKPPRVDAGARFEELSPASTQPSRATTRPVEITQWWATFHDPELDSLVDRAVRSNLSLIQAESRIREARWARVVAGAGAWPTVNVGGGYQHSRGSANIVIPPGAFGFPGAKNSGKQQPTRLDQATPVTAPPVGSQGAGATATGPPLSPLGGGGLPGVSTDLYQVGFDASWEIDVFGGVRRSVEAANADLAASLEDRHDLLITLISEVAANYIELRGYQREIAIAHENLASQQETLKLTQSRAAAGVTTQLDVARARAQVATTAAGIPMLDSQMHQAIHRISILLGEHPAALMPELLQEKPIPPVPQEVPVGLPAELLRRRPDLRRAERQLAAATARVGAATAQLYPRFTLTGTFGFDATKFTHIADWSSRYYSIGPGISWPIFDANRIRAGIHIQSEQQAQALSSYQQTVLVALQDVEDSLVDYTGDQARRQALAEAVAANRQAVDLATQQYRQGVVDFLVVLEAQRSLYLSEDSLTQIESRISSDVVALYKALGGGWEIEQAR